MINRVLILAAAAFVFAYASPSYATYWGSYGSRSYRVSNNFSWDNWSLDCDWNFNDWCDDDSQREDCDWDWNDWCNDDEQRDDCDWSWNDCDWDWNWDCDWDWKDCEPEPCDNPVPEPATAGLAFMGLTALGAATRRRRK